MAGKRIDAGKEGPLIGIGKYNILNKGAKSNHTTSDHIIEAKKTYPQTVTIRVNMLRLSRPVFGMRASDCLKRISS